MLGGSGSVAKRTPVDTVSAHQRATHTEILGDRGIVHPALFEGEKKSSAPAEKRPFTGLLTHVSLLAYTRQALRRYARPGPLDSSDSTSAAFKPLPAAVVEEDEDADGSKCLRNLAPNMASPTLTL